MRNKKFILFGIALSIAGVFLFGKNTFAYSNLEIKALGEGIYRCYNGYTKDAAVIIANSVLLSDMNKTGYVSIIANNSENFVPLPNGMYKINDSAVSCRQLFGGYHGWVQNFDGLLKKAGANVDSKSEESSKNILGLMGYAVETGAANATGTCFSFAMTVSKYGPEYNWLPAGPASTNEICSEDGSLNKVTVSGTSGAVDILRFEKKNDSIVAAGRGAANVDPRVGPAPQSWSKTFKISDYNSFEDLQAAISGFVGGTERFNESGHCIETSSTLQGITKVKGCVDIFGNYLQVRDYKESNGITYTLGGLRQGRQASTTGRERAWKAATQNLLGNLNDGTSISSYDNLAFTPNEKYLLYSFYLENYYGVDTREGSKNFDCDWQSKSGLTESVLKSNGFTIITYYKDGNMKSCAVKATKNTGSSVYALNENNHFDGSTKLELSKLVEELDEMGKKPADAGITIEDLEEEKEQMIENYESDKCYEAGLDSQAWILCPTETNLTAFAKLADKAIDGMLQVDQDLYSNDSPTKIVWDIMVGIANTLMIIILLVIIFSQLTGYGIDNYGIKKILPKLVMMAILVNLSFILCQIIVDLSNILGQGLQGLFEQAGNVVIDNDPTLKGNMDNFFDYAIPIIYAIVGVGSVAGVVASTIYATGGGALAVILIILALLGIVAAIIVFFMMLGARLIIVVLCIAVSPVAFALYILPNTNKIFKKWWELLKAALIIYPICGAAMGLSYLIKAIVVKGGVNQHLLMYVVGVMAPFLPFFMLPTLLKSAISTLGVAGAAFVSMGNAFKSNVGKAASGVDDAMKHSQRFQDYAQYHREANAARRAARTERSLMKKSGGNRANLSARDQDRLLKAEKTQTAWKMRQSEAKVGAYTPDDSVLEARAQSAKDAAEQKAYLDQFAGFSRDQLLQEGGFTYDSTTRRWNAGNISWLNQPGGSQRMSALIKAMESNGMENDIFKMLRQSNNNVGSMSGVMQTLAGSNNKVLRAYGKTGGMYANYSDFMSNGGLANYITKKGTDFIDGLDDKALEEIALNNPAAMSTDMLMATAARINSQDAVNQIDAMIKNRNGIDIKFSGEQLSKFNNSTVKELINKAQTDSDVQNMLIKASDDMAKDTKLLNSLTEPNRREINAFRNRMGQANI